jgi:hypothetical protein
MQAVRLIYLSLFFVVAGLLSACNYTRLKNAQELETFGPLSNNEKTTLMNYQYIYSRIIEPKCLRCHDSSKKVSPRFRYTTNSLRRTNDAKKWASFH